MGCRERQIDRRQTIRGPQNKYIRIKLDIDFCKSKKQIKFAKLLMYWLLNIQVYMLTEIISGKHMKQIYYSTFKFVKYCGVFVL